MGLQPPVLPVLRTCKYLRLCELRFRTRPLFLATILGGNHFIDNQVAINPYGKSPTWLPLWDAYGRLRNSHVNGRTRVARLPKVYEPEKSF